MTSFSLIQVIAADVDDHKIPVTDALSCADIFLATYGNKVDDVEAENLRRDHADLTKRYEKVADETDERDSNLDDSKKTLDLFTQKVSSFETWLVPSERTMKKLQDNVPKDPSKLKEQEKTAKKFAADVADHKEELDDTNMTGQHFIDEAKEFKDTITQFRTTVLPRKFNREYKEEPELETVMNKMTEITTRYEKLTVESTKYIETLHVIIVKHTTLESTTVGVKSVVDDREKAEDDREKKIIEDELKEHSYDLEELLKWVSAVEISLGSEQPLKEEPGQLNKQVKSNKVIAADVDDHKKPVTDALSGADIFLATYGDKVDDVEAERLRRDHADLTKRYKKVADETDDRDSNLDDSKKTLDLFTKKVSSFETWLVPSERTMKKLQNSVAKDLPKLKEQEKNAKKFAADVADHKEELDDTNMTGQHFIDEAKNFKEMIVEFRTTVLPRQFNREYEEEPELETVKHKMTEITTRYKKLTVEYTKHIEKLIVLIEKHTTFESTVDAVSPWLRKTEDEATKEKKKPVPTKPDSVQKRVDQLKDMSDDIVSHNGDVEKVKDTGRELIEVHPQVMKDVAQQVGDIVTRYEALKISATKTTNVLQTALTESQTTHDALEALVTWTDTAEMTLESLDRDTPIVIEKKPLLIIHEQVEVLKADVDSHKPSISSVCNTVKRDPKQSKALKPQTDDLNTRYNRLSNRTNLLGDYVKGRLDKLGEFLEKVDQLENWLLPVLRTLVSQELAELPASKRNKKLEDIEEGTEKKRPLYRTIQHLGQQLTKDPKASDTERASEVLKRVTTNWESLEDVLNKRNMQMRELQKNHSQFTVSAQEVTTWLDKTEDKVERLEPVAFEAPIIQKQILDHKPLAREVKEYKPKITKTTDLGKKLTEPSVGWEVLQNEVPIKRSSSFAEPTQDEREEITEVQIVRESPTPISEAYPEVKQQIEEITDRYEKLNQCIDDRQEDMETGLDQSRNVKARRDSLEDVMEWIQDMEEKIKPDEPIPEELVAATKTLNDQKVLKDVITARKVSLTDQIKTTEKFLLDNRDQLTTEQQNSLQYLLDDITQGYDHLTGLSDNKIRQLQGIVSQLEQELGEKAALKDQYKMQQYGVHELVDWVKALEERLGSQQPMKEEPEQLGQQVNEVKAIQDDVVSHEQPMTKAVQGALDFLDQHDTKLDDNDKEKLRKEADDLKSRYDTVKQVTSERVNTLTTSAENLKEFYQRIITFEVWLVNEEDTLATTLKVVPKEISGLKDHERLVKSFNHDVKRHKEDLSHINVDGQKFLDVAKEYKTQITEFRTTALPKQFTREYKEETAPAIIHDKITDLNTRYDRLTADFDKQTSKVGYVAQKYQVFRDQITMVTTWLIKIETETSSLVQEPVKSEPAQIQEQIDKLKTLNDDVISHGTDIDSLKENAKDLMESQPEYKPEVDKTILEITSRYQRVQYQITSRSTLLQTSLSQSQSVVDNLNDLDEWLKEAENEVDRLEKESPVVKREPLMDLLQEVKVLQSDIDNHRPTLDAIRKSPESRSMKPQVDDVTGRFRKLDDRAKRRGLYLQGRVDKLSDFLDKVDELEDWLLPTLRDVESVETGRKPAEDLAQKQKDVTKQMDTYHPMYDTVNRLSKELTKDPKASNTAPVTDIIDNVNKNWEALLDALKKRNEQLEERQFAEGQFTGHVKYVTDWLDKTEAKVDQLEAVADDTGTLKQQMNEHKPILKDVKAFKPKVEKAQELGTTLDTMTEETAPLTPLVPHVRSTILEESEAPVEHVEEMTLKKEDAPEVVFKEPTPVQRQLSDITTRYETLDDKVTDRQEQLDTNLDVAEKKESLKGMLDWVKEQGDTLTSVDAPKYTGQVDEKLKVQQDVQNELATRQNDIDTIIKATEENLLKNKDKLTPEQQRDIEKTVDDLKSAKEKVQEMADNKLKELEAEKGRKQMQLQEEADIQQKCQKDIRLLNDLLAWVVATEEKLGLQQPLREESHTARAQVKELEAIQDDVKKHEEPVYQTLQDVQLLVASSADKMTPESKTTLQDTQSELRNDMTTCLIM
ncbi:uncharacterized protein LOC100375618 [Saccoglossus kowalevskii]